MSIALTVPEFAISTMIQKRKSQCSKGGSRPLWCGSEPGNNVLREALHHLRVQEPEEEVADPKLLDALQKFVAALLRVADERAGRMPRRIDVRNPHHLGHPLDHRIGGHAIWSENHEQELRQLDLGGGAAPRPGVPPPDLWPPRGFLRREL